MDVWSCGVILYTLLCAKLPFVDEYMPNLFKKIKEGNFVFPPHVSDECKQLISSMLVVDQLKRSTLAEIRDHPWVKKNWPKHLKKIPPLVLTQAITNFDNNVVTELMSVSNFSFISLSNAMDSFRAMGRKSSEIFLFLFSAHFLEFTNPETRNFI